MYRLLSDEGSKAVTDVAHGLTDEEASERGQTSTLLHARADVMQMNYFWSFLNGFCSCFGRGGLKRGED